MSFHEKSALVCLVSISLIYGPYFVVVSRFPMASLGLFWVAAGGLVMVLTLFHIANALATRSIRTTGNVPSADELDQRIELKASKGAGFILAFAVMSWILYAMYTIPVVGQSVREEGLAGGVELSPFNFVLPVFTAMLAVQWLFAGFVVANLVYYGGIVIGYRRLASA